MASLARSSYYYRAAGEIEENLRLMRLLDEQHTRTPYYGIRRMTAWLRTAGYEVNHKRVSRLLRRMGLRAVYPKPRLSQGGPEHKVYPYPLHGLAIQRPTQVWGTDITYIRLRHGFVFLVAIMDWFSRHVLAWEVSVTMDTSFCLSALDLALLRGKPEIFNSDQGLQFTSDDFTSKLKGAGIRISMGGRGRVFDNIFVERLWRTVKYEEVYLKGYESVPVAVASLGSYFGFYNSERLHQSLGYRTPLSVFAGAR